MHFEFGVPPSPEQHRIAAVLSTIDEAIEKTETLIAKLRHVKEGLMQDLLTKGIDEVGKIRSETTHAFKDTIIGRVPIEWETANIGKLASHITVGFVGSMSALFVNEGVPLLRGQNILPNSLDLRNLKYISHKTHNIWKKSALIANDIVIVRVGYPGTACVIPKGLGNLNAASLVIVRPIQKVLNSQMLCYILNSPWGKEQIRRRLVGGAQQVVNTHTIAQFIIPFPSISEQYRITVILAAAEDRITKEEAYYDKLLTIKQGLMADLLTGRVRVPEEGFV